MIEQLKGAGKLLLVFFGFMVVFVVAIVLAGAVALGFIALVTEILKA